LDYFHVQDNLYKSRQAAKAVEDCLKTISEHYNKLKLTEVMQKLRTASPEEKLELMKELQALSAKS